MEQNKAKERFTKTWAIEQHRKMWHWIAEQVRNGKIIDTKEIWKYKREYIKEQYHRYYVLSTSSYCLCCLFSGFESRRVNRDNYNVYGGCDYCPLEMGGCRGGSDFVELVNLGLLITEEKRQYAIQLCEQIAEAPERKV